QVLLNLVNNAVEAMRDAGIAKPMLSICTREAGSMVEVEVTDNGPGIAPELAEQLFMPFFTTKAEGMGIGLNICRSVIE
ncbi:ATP-binding protein, partial [Klebsiella pneumoniae]